MSCDPLWCKFYERPILKMNIDCNKENRNNIDSRDGAKREAQGEEAGSDAEIVAAPSVR
jgi:hypothetical protein